MAAAAELYSGPMHAALAKQWPGKRKYTVLEDNDPTGNQSKKGPAAKLKGMSRKK